MPSFPAISFGRVAMYPLERNASWKTAVCRFLNDEEQRWVQQNPKQVLVLTFTDVDQASYNTLYSFWTSVVGAGNTTWSLNLGTDPVTGQSYNYSNMGFVGDDFTATQTKPNRWKIVFHVRQIQ